MRINPLQQSISSSLQLTSVAVWKHPERAWSVSLGAVAGR
jgi:hypothetical protein